MNTYNTDHLSDAEMMRYARQILLDDWDLQAQHQLKTSHAIIVGMGGLGCSVAQTLVRAGLSRLTIIDDDVIDPSNLQRQCLYFDTDIDKPKAMIAKSALHQHNPLTQIEAHAIRLTHDNAQQLIGETSLVIDCTDNFAVRDVLNHTCRHRQLPLLSTSAIGEIGQLALYTEATGCYRCVFGDDVGEEISCATSGVLASTVAVIAAMASQVALMFLGKGANPIAGKLIAWQGQTMTLKHHQFTRDASCPVCGSTP